MTAAAASPLRCDGCGEALRPPTMRMQLTVIPHETKPSITLNFCDIHCLARWVDNRLKNAR